MLAELRFWAGTEAQPLQNPAKLNYSSMVNPPVVAMLG